MGNKLHTEGTDAEPVEERGNSTRSARPAPDKNYPLCAEVDLSSN